MDRILHKRVADCLPSLPSERAPHLHSKSPVDETTDRLYRPEIVYSRRCEIAKAGWVHLACRGSKDGCPNSHRYQGHVGSFVVAIDGACPSSSRSWVRSSIGVFFGRGNPLNVAHVLDMAGRHTNQAADLVACRTALKNCSILQSEIEKSGNSLDHVVIKTDSESVVRGVTEWISKWKKNKWRTTRGRPVANREYFEEIEALVENLERKTVVKFWLVRRKQNAAADGLAQSALRADQER